MCWNTSFCELLVESMQPRAERKREQSPLSTFQIPTKKSLMIFMFSICHDKIIPLTMWWNIFLKWKGTFVIFLFLPSLNKVYLLSGVHFYWPYSLETSKYILEESDNLRCGQTRNKFSTWHVLRDVWPCPYKDQVLLRFYLQYQCSMLQK